MKSDIPQKKTVLRLYNDNFQNYKRYNIPKAQLVIADIPYNIGINAYASSPEWYVKGDNKNGASRKAGKAFFGTDTNFNIAEYFHFCNRLLKKRAERKRKSALHDCILFLPAIEYSDRICPEIWIPALYPTGILQKLFRSGVKVQHENCRGHGIRLSALSR